MFLWISGHSFARFSKLTASSGVHSAALVCAMLAMATPRSHVPVAANVRYASNSEKI